MDAVDIGVRLVEERERVGYNQTSFARVIGISRVALRSIEEGKSDFKMSVLIAAAAAGVDVQYVLTGVRSNNTDFVAEKIGLDRTVINGNISGVGIAQSGSNVQVNFTSKITHKTKAVTNPGVEHITIEQRAILKELVDQVVEHEKTLKESPKSHRAVWSSLNKHCNSPTYHLIRSADFEKARKFLRMWIGRLNSSASAPVKVGDAWRKRYYAYIKANTKDPADTAALKTYMQKNYKADSLTQLANDELEAVYRYVAGRISRKS